MNRIPIAFAFDNNLAMPAAVCIYSLLASAEQQTAYDIYVLHRSGEQLDLSLVERVLAQYPDSTLTLREVGSEFDSSFEIRGITTPAYYRLLIPELIPEHDRIIYSDVDVIFRQDLSRVYAAEMGDCLVAGVNDLAHIDPDLRAHYEGTLGLDPQGVICSGFLVMDGEKLRREGMKEKWVALAENRYKFQDQDIINLSCAGRIKMLEPKYSVLTYITHYCMTRGADSFEPLWSSRDLDEAMHCGNIHYNGQKPWRGWCLCFDIWWEYYRKSPIFDEKFYFDFYRRRLDEYDRLPLMKRIKILARYFLHGKTK